MFFFTAGRRYPASSVPTSKPSVSPSSSLVPRHQKQQQQQKKPRKLFGCWNQLSYRRPSTMLLLFFGAVLCSLGNMILLLMYDIDNDPLRTPHLTFLWGSLLLRKFYNFRAIHHFGTPLPVDVEIQESSLQPNSTFSACLLIKDDNDILNEWLAYHYFVLNLRTLIVAIDPTSQTSPSPLFERWRTKLPDFEIVEWIDEDYMPEDFIERGHNISDEHLLPQSEFPDETTNLTVNQLYTISIHRWRQRVFLARCMNTLKYLGRSWMIHIDTDEYVTISKLLRTMKTDDIQVPDMSQPGAVLGFLQQMVRLDSTKIHYPCIGLLRVLFGAHESTPDAVHDKIPVPFNSTLFETLRWRYHGRPQDYSLRKFPKMIIDVSAVPYKYMPQKHAKSVHRPIEEFCLRRNELKFQRFRKVPLSLNHYLGSWERYAKRNDTRRKRELYEKKTKQLTTCCHDDFHRPWLQGFVNLVGIETAKVVLNNYLLSGVVVAGTS